MAQRYDAASRNYGVARVLDQIFSSQGAEANAFKQQKALGDVAYTPKVRDHLNALIGPERTNQFLQALSPGRQVIDSGDGVSIGAHVPGVPVRSHFKLPFTFGGPQGPTAFQPLWARAIRPATGLSQQEINEWIEGGLPSGGVTPHK